MRKKADEDKFKDAMDENKPADHGPTRKDSKAGRKLLGIFNRGKQKKKSASDRRPEQESEDAERPDVDVGSIISDAVLRDRHDRFVSKLG